MTNLTDFAWHVPVEEPFSFFLSTDPRDPTAGHAFLDACSVARRIINEDEYEALKKAHQRDYVGVVSFAAWLTKRMHEFYASTGKAVDDCFEIIFELENYLRSREGKENEPFGDNHAFMYLNLVCSHDYPASPSVVVTPKEWPAQQLIAFPVNAYGTSEESLTVMSRQSIIDWWKTRSFLHPTNLLVSSLKDLSDAHSYAQVYASAYATFTAARERAERGLQKASVNDAEIKRVSVFAINAMAMGAAQAFGLTSPKPPEYPK